MPAGISADYYLRLEQGRDHRPSPEVRESPVCEPWSGPMPAILLTASGGPATQENPITDPITDPPSGEKE
ncbi:hypothetical protein GA0115259_112493 [Streptomyces sp. MnatMP-M17]|nr:hypothetical protein GA0115259_112493 [Streptomyces sp. MnatMP-M17]